MSKLDKYKLPNQRNEATRSNEKVEFVSFDMEDNLKELGKGKKYFIRTHGCQANQRDSEEIAGLLESMGYVSAVNQEDSDICIINTCAVRQGAEEKVYGEVGALKQIKRKKEDFIIGVCGCMAQESESVKQLIMKYPQVDIIFGTHNIASLPKLIKETYENKETVVEILEGHNNTIVEDAPVTRFAGHKAWVNIMYGCDKFCTYCIVPYTRGKERSRRKEDILAEVETLKKQGYKEVCLLGQNVNAYGNDLYDDYGFGDLLNDAAKTNINRIRFVTSHPWNFNDSMIKAMKDNDNVMPYLHLPLQSGSTNILKKMNRRYTSEEYKALFDKIRKELPHYSITTDIIVGFPGESEEDFKATLDMVEYCKYDNAYTFIYSPRQGTPAATMEDHTPMKEKEERLQRLHDVVNKYSALANQKYEGQIVEVLVDGFSKKNDTVYSGYTKDNKLVNFKGENINVGDLVNVKVTNAKSFTLDGELVK